MSTHPAQPFHSAIKVAHGFPGLFVHLTLTLLIYKGHNKLASLSKFFDSVLDGTVDLTAHPSSNEDTTAEPPTAPIFASAEPQEASSSEQTVLVEREDETDAATDSETEAQPKTNVQTHTDEPTPEGRLDDEL
jgi:hypothetical protein